MFYNKKRQHMAEQWTRGIMLSKIHELLQIIKLVSHQNSFFIFSCKSMKKRKKSYYTKNSEEKYEL